MPFVFGIATLSIFVESLGVRQVLQWCEAPLAIFENGVAIWAFVLCTSCRAALRHGATERFVLPCHGDDFPDMDIFLNVILGRVETI